MRDLVDIDGDTFILVASVVKGDYYDGYTEEIPYDNRHPASWVTVVPELKDFFAEKTVFPDVVCLRVVQLLGMRPEDASGGCSLFALGVFLLAFLPGGWFLVQALMKRTEA